MNPKDKIDQSWQPLKDLLDKDEDLRVLNTQILPKCTYYPEREDIFNVFQMPVKDIKVVILGQDPYPRKGQAIGYAFAVSEETSKPASLRVIEKELGHEIDKTLLKWREQGIFLLNTALTVEAGKAGSHLTYWQNYIKEVIKYISDNTDAIFLLWGRKAQQTFGDIAKNKIYAPHPAAEAYNPGAGFIGSKCFQKVNETLISQGKQKINW